MAVLHIYIHHCPHETEQKHATGLGSFVSALRDVDAIDTWNLLASSSQ